MHTHIRTHARAPSPSPYTHSQIARGSQGMLHPPASPQHAHIDMHSHVSLSMAMPQCPAHLQLRLQQPRALKIGQSLQLQHGQWPPAQLQSPQKQQLPPPAIAATGGAKKNGEVAGAQERRQEDCRNRGNPGAMSMKHSPSKQGNSAAEAQNVQLLQACVQDS